MGYDACRIMALPTPHRAACAALLVLLLAGPVTLTGCVYRLDVQQGNLLDQEDIDAIVPGMTRSQVRYLLGTPVAADPFRPDRWDYMYYLKPGKSRKTTQRWVVVWFEGDIVREVSQDVPVSKKG
jgi:outer membrane protein assembly factor BamE